MKEIIYQDSYTEKTDYGSLKVYLDMTNLEECNEKLKNFNKIRHFVNLLHNARFDKNELQKGK